jgi:hypothetical protein
MEDGFLTDNIINSTVINLLLIRSIIDDFKSLKEQNAQF